MMSVSDMIARLIDEAAPKIAVVFSGSEPRLIGTLESAPSAQAIKTSVDAMLFTHHLSATSISRATCRNRLFVAAHA
jgi:hypothetical protein